MIKIYNGSAGEHRDTVINKLIDMAKRDKCIWICEFNGTIIQADKYSTFESVEKIYEYTSDINYENYKNSDYYKNMKIQEEIRKTENQKEYNLLMEKFYILDFNNKIEVLEWCRDIISLLDSSDIDRSQQINVISKFSELGYKQDMNCNENYIENDIENNYGYLIGQFMTMCPHPMLRNFMNDFISKWR